MGILQNGTLFDRSSDAHVAVRPHKTLVQLAVAMGRVLRGSHGDGWSPRAGCTG